MLTKDFQGSFRFVNLTYAKNKDPHLLVKIFPLKIDSTLYKTRLLTDINWVIGQNFDKKGFFVSLPWTYHSLGENGFSLVCKVNRDNLVVTAGYAQVF